MQGQRVPQVGAKAVAGLQNAAGVVMDALEDDGESEESGGKARSGMKPGSIFKHVARDTGFANTQTRVRSQGRSDIKAEGPPGRFA